MLKKEIPLSTQRQLSACKALLFQKNYAARAPRKKTHDKDNDDDAAYVLMASAA